jgi:glycosyltransferase involved in cell wall biosynthesis
MLNRKMDFRVIIAGKGDDPAMDVLKDLSNVEVINRFIQDEELDFLLKGAIATLLPYDSATQSGVILHSYSYQVPVVSFDVGKLSEYITPDFSGHLVEYKNITAFVDAMADMAQKSHEYRENVANEFKKYDDYALHEQYESLLSDIAS